MNRLFACLIVLMIWSSVSLAEPLNCDVGPVIRELGGTQWQVTSCSDNRSLVFVTAAGNPAMPFVFMVLRTDEPTKINGEGNGSKEHSAAAYDSLKMMTEHEFDALVEATVAANKD